MFFFLLGLFMGLLSAISTASADQPVNLTENNRKALADMTQEYRRTELMRISRGRIKSNPIILPLFTYYQTVLTDQDLLITRQLNEYHCALEDMQRARTEFQAVAATGLGRQITTEFNKRLIDAYDITDAVQDTNSILDLWHVMFFSGLQIQRLPLEYRLALNTAQWLNKLHRGQPPQDAQARLLELVQGKQEVARSLFQSDAILAELSGEFAKLVAESLSGEAAP